VGTPDPLVRIEAATLAGGDNNQDRYAYGDGWAFVLDGASSFGGAPAAHDGGWYAQQLKDALAEQLASDFSAATPDIVASAIKHVSGDHNAESQGPCPTSTIALVRWDKDSLETYILGDSYVVLVSKNGSRPKVTTDDRISRIGTHLRNEYRQALIAGHGFDENHRRRLSALQRKELNARNSLGGYWIAGDEPKAAYHAIVNREDKRDTTRAILFTDGITTCKTPEQVLSMLLDCPQPDCVLSRIQNLETEDANAALYPRSKPHDDKTIICITLAQ